jgi:hypothetical protein
VVIERRHFVHLCHRHSQCISQRDQVSCVQAAIAILNFVEVLDQQVAAAWRIAEQGENLGARRRFDTPALRG